MQTAVETAVQGGEEQCSSAVRHPLWQRILFSDVFLSRTRAQKIAYIGVMAALCIAVNMFEFKFADVQFSFTVFISMLTGILLGPAPGAAAVFVGDAVGYLVNSMGYFYYWWVALSVAVMAVIAGAVMKVPLTFRGALYVKLALICLLTFAVCTVGINTSGMYYIGLNIYTSPSVLEAFETHFGGEQSYAAYLFIRLFVLGQVYNSIFNYVLFFAAVPALCAVKPLGLRLR